MTVKLQPATERGTANFGWLDSKHSFSFGSYYDPDKVHFGALRVLNDDVVAGGKGFGSHPHDNMEIISIPLRGALLHKDSEGNEHVLPTGQVQAMSAGSGIVHSEHNESPTEEVEFLQIWIMPETQNIAPRYSQKEFPAADRRNKLQLVVSPDGRDGSLAINQQAYISRAELGNDDSLEYVLKDPANGVYAFLIEGQIVVDGQQLKRRDAAEVSGTARFDFRASEAADVLLLEVPL